jgi:hypothetical protein
VFYGGETEMVEPCPGYVGADGKPFPGGLALVVLERGKVVNSFIIQRPPDEDAEPRCTSVANARDALARAKQTLQELGIERSTSGGSKLVLTRHHGKPKETKQKREGQPTTRTDWQDTWSGPDVSFRLSASDVCGEEGYCDRSLTGTLLGLNGAARKVLARRTLSSEEWSHNAAGSLSMRFFLFRSPSQKVLLPFLFLDHFRMEGSWSTSHFLGPVASPPQSL